jgi:Ca-activated chloride channel family protein
MTMTAKRHALFLLAVPGVLFGFVLWMGAQEDVGQGSGVIRKVVDMVQLNVAVTDAKGNYITNLRPNDFTISEDKIPQSVASFEEGNEAPRVVASAPGAPPVAPAPPGAASVREASVRDMPPPPRAGAMQPITAATNGASVFILFDSSNYMFHRRGFVFAQDSISEFVRSLDGADRVAFYSYSRDLTRASLLTADRSQVLHGVRGTVNGDDSALYNALLLTLKDAAQYTGRRVVVVFSNGPDNSSMVPPEDVSELAQSEGVPIYMISTREAQLDPISAIVFTRMTANTGGQAYFAKDWHDQEQAFSSIREDLAHLYFLSYYPQPNPNRGWRAINVKLVGKNLQKYHIRTRSGYRPLPARVSVDAAPTPSGAALSNN